MTFKPIISRTLLVTIFAVLIACTSKKQQSEVIAEKFELEEKTVAQLQQLMSDGVYSSKSITQLYLDRIAKIDQNEGGLNAVIELNSDALTIAEAMNAERIEGKIRGRYAASLSRSRTMSIQAIRWKLLPDHWLWWDQE